MWRNVCGGFEVKSASLITCWNVKEEFGIYKDKNSAVKKEKCNS
jgi:hypothetical protein